MRSLLPNTIENPQHRISVPPGGIEANFKNPRYTACVYLAEKTDV